MTLEQIATSQFGLVTREQLSDLGMTRHGIQHLLDRGDVIPVYRSIYKVRGAPNSWHRDLLAACFRAGPGAVASHRSAAALWKLPGFKQGALDVMTSRSVRLTEVQVRRSSLEDDDRDTVDGIPTTSLIRTLIDLGSCVEQKLVEDAIDDSIRRRLLTLSELRAAASSPGTGKRGFAAFRKAVEATDIRVIATGSVFESRLLRVLAKARLPRPVPQYTIRDNGRFVARVDFAFPGAKVLIEAESLQWHSSSRAKRRDTTRFNELQALGWVVIRVTWRDLEDPERLIRRLRKVLTPCLFS